MNWIINGYHKSRHSIVMTIAIMLVFRDKSRQFLSLFIHFVIWLQITDYSALRGMLTKEGNLLQCFLWRRSWNILVNLANGIVNKNRIFSWMISSARSEVMAANSSDYIWTTTSSWEIVDISNQSNSSILATRLSDLHHVSPVNPYHPFAWPLEVAVIFIILYSMTTLLAIIGNIATIIVFTKGKRSKTDIRPFLLNLAFSDLIMAIFCIPFTFTHELLGTWVFSRPMCPIVVFLQTVSVSSSVSTNMVVGIDRFHAIVSPLKSHNATSRSKIIILCIWIFAVSLSAVQLKVCETTNKNGSMRCDEEWPTDGLRIAYSVIVLMLTYVIPLLILTFTYSIVGCVLWKRKTPGNADAQRDSYQIKSKKKVSINVDCLYRVILVNRIIAKTCTHYSLSL